MPRPTSGSGTARRASAAAPAAGTRPRSDRCGRPESGCSQTACTRRSPESSADRRSARSRRSCRRAPPSVGTENVRVSDRRIRVPFVAGEEERPVPHQRAAERSAELVLPQRRHAAGPPDGSSSRASNASLRWNSNALPRKRVAAGLGRDVDQRRRLAAELRRVHRLLDLEFLDRVDRRVDRRGC